VASWLSTERSGRAPWWLVPLTWVWATAHGMFTVGIAVSTVCCMGLLLDRSVDRRTAARMLAVPGFSLVASCLTPLGPRLLTGQLAVGERASMIEEWGATSFRDANALLLAVMIGLVVVRWSLRGGVSWTRLLLLLLAAGCGMLVTRMVPCSAVMVAPVLAGSLHQALTTRPPVRVTANSGELSAVAVGSVVLLAALALAVPQTSSRAGGVPLAFSARLAALPAGSAVAVEDGTGSWIEWRFPQLDPVIDGMLDAYPVGYVEDFFDATRLEPGWESFVGHSGARIALLVKGSPMSSAFQGLGWRPVQYDDKWVLLVAPSGADGAIKAA
jgi:hypothetical protein